MNSFLVNTLRKRAILFIALFALLSSLSIVEEDMIGCNKYSTDIHITNKFKDSVKVYLTLQSPERVVGHFGIKDTTPNNPSQGYFWALKDSIYSSSNKGNKFSGFVISFDTINMPCNQAINNGYSSGINVFEGSINVKYESFDISCVDGVNSVIEVSTSDTINWTTGDGKNERKFRKTSNNKTLKENYNIRGVYPFRCTDCIDHPNATKNCFNLPDSCNSKRICQVNRYNSQGGYIKVVYKESVR